MTTAVALREGTAIFPISGKHVVLNGFFGDTETFEVFLAVTANGYWYQSLESMIIIPAEQILALISTKGFITVNKKAAAPSEDEIDAWHQNPHSLRDRFPVVDAYCRKFFLHSPSRDKWIAQDRITRRAIRAAVRRMDEEELRA